MPEETRELERSRVKIIDFEIEIVETFGQN